MIEVQGLSYSYGRGSVIDFKDFTVHQGNHCLLLGESGSGKTTLLHLLGGILRSQKGRISINGTDLTKLSGAALDRFRGRQFGFVFQKNHLISALSVRENLLMAPFLAGVNQDPVRVQKVMEQLSITSQADASVTEVSQGQAQRVAIARAVLNRPTVILADEPTSALDDKTCSQVIDLLLETSSQNKATLLVATHDQRLKSSIKYQVRL